MGIILYVLGLVVLASGIACLATLIGIAQPYIAGVVLVMLAVALVSHIVNARTRSQEPA
jgi:hypothetical protein